MRRKLTKEDRWRQAWSVGDMMVSIEGDMDLI